MSSGQPGRLQHAKNVWLPTTNCGIATCLNRAIGTTGLAPVRLRPSRPLHARNRLVTSIEILSPVNKREPGLSKYRDKRRQLHAADVHILEIDLLRRGQRPLVHPRIPQSAYRITLIRAAARCADIWSLRLQD